VLTSLAYPRDKMEHTPALHANTLSHIIVKAFRREVQAS